MSLWDERDEPVLSWLVESPPRANILTTHRRGTAPHHGVPSLTQAQVHRAVETLHDAGYVSSDGGQGEGGGGVNWTRFQVTGTGKQALGLWPKFDALGEPAELADILEALAENAPTEEEASNLERAAAAVRRAAPGVVRGIAVAGLSAGARLLLGG
jgi:hypothetical protein